MKKTNLILIVLLMVFALPAWTQIRFSEEMSIRADEFTSVAYDDVNVWTSDARDQTLSAFDPISGEKIYSVKLSANGEYLAFDGMRMLLTQNETKRVMVVNRATGEVEPYIDLKSIQGDRDLYLEPLRSGEIMGITYDNNRLWVGCGAGYSSSIYEIDPLRHVVVSHRFAPGPTPVSLIHHEGNLWVLDKESAALRCLKDANQLVYDLSIPVENAVALLNLKEKLFVARKGNAFQGVVKNDLTPLVPKKISREAFAPFKNKARKAESVRERKVAVIISGDTAASGYNEFWIDVVIMYRILKARGYNEMYVLYADGKDYTCGWSKYEEPGMTDFAATWTYVDKIFNALANGSSELNIKAMTSSDTLFVYTFDHGASNGKLCLWGGYYSPDEMYNIMRNINCNKKMFYMQQCFSGAFKEKFSAGNLQNMAIVTAASNTQYAYRADTEKETYNGKTFYHGEFNWHFMSALAGATPAGATVNADANSDGKVSVYETYTYYQKMNSQSAQTPQYKSIPDAVGNDTTP